MTSRPTDLPDWASSPSSPSDVEEPSASKQAEGWDFEDTPPYNWINWFWRQSTRWMEHFATTSSRFALLEDAIDAAAASGALAAGDTFILDENDGANRPGAMRAFEPLDPPVADPIRMDVTGRSIVGGNNSTIAAVSRDGSTTLATYTTTNSITTFRSIASDGRYVLVAHDNYIECFDHDSGASQWVYDHGGAVNDVAIGTDLAFMVGADVSSVAARAIDLAAGTVTWNYDHGADLESVEYAGFQLLIGGAASSKGSAATFRAIESATGEDAANEGGNGASSSRSAFDSTSGSFDGPYQIATDGRIYAMKTGATAFGLYGLAGTQIATNTLPDDITGLAMDHQLVFASTYDGAGTGHVVALEKAQLGVLWFSETELGFGQVVTDGAAVYAPEAALAASVHQTFYRGNGGPEVWRRADPATEKTLCLRQLAVPAL